MSERKLRSVAEGDRKPKAKNVAQATETGTDREALIALRSRIAMAIDDAATPARDLAALSRRLTDIMREIKALESEEGGDDLTDATRLADAAFTASSL